MEFLSANWHWQYMIKALDSLCLQTETECNTLLKVR